MFAQTLDGQPISAGIGSSQQQQAYQSLAESLNLGATGPGVYTDGEPLDPDVERAAFALADPAIDGDPLQTDVEQAALALPDPAIDGEPLQSDVEKALEPYDPFADAPKRVSTPSTSPSSGYKINAYGGRRRRHITLFGL